ncbi:MAG: phosphoribosyltransferase family protein [Patescibacteria group bacterium]
MAEERFVQMLERAGAVLRGHFVGTSGKHLDTYVNKAAITDPYDRLQIASAIALGISTSVRVPIDVVVGPEVDGVRFSDFVALWLQYGGIRTQGLCAYKPKRMDSDEFDFRGNEHMLQGASVAVVDDIVNTGKTTRKVIRSVQDHGGNIVALGTLWNRSGMTLRDLQDPARPIEHTAVFIRLIDRKLPAWDAPCPLCDQDVLIDTQVGHGGKTQS